jgi:8-oxo-dGTP diphosphatase
LTVDVAITCDKDSIILIKRKNEPYKNFWALPGGFVEYGETVESAALREVKEETQLEVKLNRILGVYSDPRRDPRGHMVTICFIASILRGRLKADTDATEARCFVREEIYNLNLAFDHKNILEDFFII